jgi:hypothetical protein
VRLNDEPHIVVCLSPRDQADVGVGDEHAPQPVSREGSCVTRCTYVDSKPSGDGGGYADSGVGTTIPDG